MSKIKSKREKVEITVRAKVVINGMAARNRCPHCNSDFITNDGNDLITSTRYKRVFVCQDCGKMFAHLYKLTYDQSLGVGGEEND